MLVKNKSDVKTAVRSKNKFGLLNYFKLLMNWLLNYWIILNELKVHGYEKLRSKYNTDYDRSRNYFMWSLLFLHQFGHVSKGRLFYIFTILKFFCFVNRYRTWKNILEFHKHILIFIESDTRDKICTKWCTRFYVIEYNRIFYFRLLIIDRKFINIDIFRTIISCFFTFALIQFDSCTQGHTFLFMPLNICRIKNQFYLHCRKNVNGLRIYIYIYTTSLWIILLTMIKFTVLDFT